MHEDRLGNPMDFPEKPIQPNNKAKEKHESIREEDSGLGIPLTDISPTRILSKEETEKYKIEREIEEAKARQHAHEMMTVLNAEEGFILPKSLQKAFSLFLLLVSAFLGLIIISESVQFFSNIHSFNVYLRWTLTIIFTVFLGFITIVIASLLKKVLQLQRSPRINSKALKVLAERKQMQAFAREKQAKAQKILKEYLQAYPTDKNQENKLIAMGMEHAQYENLLLTQKRLLTSNQAMSPSDWCDTFQSAFQSVLDVVAYKRVKQYALRVTIGTGASPLSIIDRIIVLYSSFALIKDLLTIYHLRPASGQSIAIFTKAIMLTYLSGIIGDGTEYLADSIHENLADLTDSNLDTLAGTLGSAVSAKAAEAGLNGFFISRLGKRTIQLLQPIS